MLVALRYTGKSKISRHTRLMPSLWHFVCWRMQIGSSEHNCAFEDYLFSPLLCMESLLRQHAFPPGGQCVVLKQCTLPSAFSESIHVFERCGTMLIESLLCGCLGQASLFDWMLDVGSGLIQMYCFDLAVPPPRVIICLGKV